MVCIRYTSHGWTDSQEYKDEVAFRHKILGPKHWSGMSMYGDRREISLYVKEEHAILFLLKYPSCRVDKKVEPQ